MKKYEKLYEELRKQYSVQEISESILIPADLTAEERKEANESIKKLRFKMLRQQTEDQRIFSDVMRLKIVMGEYIQNGSYTAEQSFGRYLEEYARILNITKKKLADDLAIHYTRLSRIINDHENPNVELAYRLEKHSGGLISALSWWRLVVKKQEHEIKKNNETREKEGRKVKNPIKPVV